MGHGAPCNGIQKRKEEFLGELGSSGKPAQGPGAHEATGLNPGHLRYPLPGGAGLDVLVPPILDPGGESLGGSGVKMCARFR